MRGNLFRRESPSGMLFGIASVLGLIFTIVFTLASVYAGSFDLSAITIIISLGIVNGILATICVILSRDSYNLLGDKSTSDVSLLRAETSLVQLRSEVDEPRIVQTIFLCLPMGLTKIQFIPTLVE